MTSNQINYWRMRNDKLNQEATIRHNQAVLAENKRVNLINEELKRIDQDLQRDLNAINARYKEKELALRAEELKHNVAYRQAQLRQEEARIAINRMSNELNQLHLIETQRANKAQESLKQQTINLDRAMLSVEQRNVESRTYLNQTQSKLINAQTKTESKRPSNVQSQTFSNYFQPFVNLAGSVLRAIF